MTVGGLSINEFSRDGNLAGNSNLAIPTEQAVKTYVDNQITQVNNTKADIHGAVDQDFAANHLSVGSNLQVSGNLEVNSGLHTTGAVSIDGNLTVSNGITTNELSVIDTVTTPLTINNTLTVNSAIAASSLRVTETVTAGKFQGDGSMLTGITKWSLAYAHDKTGQKIAGDINSLIEAIEAGHSVRVLMEGNDLQYVTDAENLWIKNGIVYAQNTSHVSVTFQGDVLKFKDDSYWWMVIVSTKGDRDMIRWNVGEHKSRGHTQDKVAIKWFIG
ncbi:MAG: hypothetical protein F6K26_03895 [Moorea sp. SIO2I5]|nr:hypothetical protein [Moorena sp. SIO2I5]